MSRGILRETRGQRPWRAGQVLADQRGQLIPMVLSIMVIITIISTAFVINLVVRQQLGGRRYRVMTARYLAEAAVERTLWTLETGSEDPTLPEGSLDLAAGSGALLPGRFRVEEIRNEGNGLFSIVAAGDFSGAHRTVRAIAKLSPRVLTYALFGQGPVRFEGTNARAYLIPANLAAGRTEGGHLGSNTELRFVSQGVDVDEFSGAKITLRDGVQFDFALLGADASLAREQVHSRVGKLVLPGGAVVTVGSDGKPLPNPSLLGSYGVGMGMEVVSTREREDLPLVARAVLLALAKANAENAELNRAVSSQGWPLLLQRDESVYTREDFLHIIEFLAKGSSYQLRGPIYVKGPVAVPKDASITLLDGFLAVEGGVTVEPGGRLEVRHSPRFQAFPGIITFGQAAPIMIQQHGVLIVDGLVYAEGTFDAGQDALIDIRGALLGADPRLSIHLHDATLVVRYEPSILSTVGIQAKPKSKKIVRVVSWEELRH